MKVLYVVLSVISLISILSEIICGLWIKSNAEKITDMASSVGFHMNLGIFTVVVTVAALVVGLIRK
jgi:hypothetical protein